MSRLVGRPFGVAVTSYGGSGKLLSEALRAMSDKELVRVADVA